MAAACACVLAWGLLGEPPRFGFAPALSVTAWLVLTVYAVESQLFPQLKARWALAGLGAVAVLLALVFPGTPLHASASPWLPLHWALGIASYGLFAAAVVHAWLMTRAEKQIRQAADPHARRAAADAGAAHLPLRHGGLRAAVGHSAGRPAFQRIAVRPRHAAKWDHKTVFSVLAWLVFAFLLLGRARFGWRGRKATRVLYIGLRAAAAGLCGFALRARSGAGRAA